MKLNIKNSQLKKILEKGQSDSSIDIQAEDKREACLSIVGGYLCSLLEISERKEVNLILDVTYETVKNLSLAIANEFGAGMAPGSQYSVETNIEIAEKTISAYLMCLAINEENANFWVVWTKNQTAETIFSPILWSGMKIEMNNGMQSVDFLKEIHGSVHYENHQVIVEMDKANNAYKRLTGRDLVAFGVDGVIAELG